MTKKYIGNMRVDEVDREIAEAMFAHLHDQGYKNLGQLRMVLAQAFEYAVEEDYIRKNPFRKVELPTTERCKNIALTVERGTDHSRPTPHCCVYHGAAESATLGTREHSWAPNGNKGRPLCRPRWR